MQTKTRPVSMKSCLGKTGPHTGAGFRNHSYLTHKRIRDGQIAR